MKFSNDWFWVIHRKNGEILASGWAGSVTKQEMLDLFPKYRGYKCSLVRGSLARQKSKYLTAEQLKWSFSTLTEALSGLHDAFLKREERK